MANVRSNIRDEREDIAILLIISQVIFSHIKYMIYKVMLQVFINFPFAQTSDAYNLFCKRLEMNYENECSRMIAQFRTELAFRQNYDKQQIDNYANVREANNLWTEQELKDIEEKFTDSKRVFARDSVIKQEVYRNSAIDYIEKTGEQMTKMLETMKSNFGLHGVEKKYEQLFEENAVESAEIEKLEVAIQKKQKVLSTLEKEFKEAKIVHSTEMTALTDGKLSEFMHLRALERQIDAMECEFGKLLKHLVIKAHEVTMVNTIVNSYQKFDELQMSSLNVQSLQARLRKADHLMGILDTCRRYQTQREKITVPQSPKAMGAESVCSIIIICCILLYVIAIVSKINFQSIDGFLSPEATMLSEIIAKINMENHELLEEKKELVKDNEKLRQNIQKYCEHQKYEAGIEKLKLSKQPTVGVPKQEASHMCQLELRSKRCFLCEGREI